MNIDTILENNLNGDAIHDGIIIGVVFIIIFLFYRELFKAVFSIFK